MGKSASTEEILRAFSGIEGSFFFQAEDGIRVRLRSRGLGDVYKRQAVKVPIDATLRISRLGFVTKDFKVRSLLKRKRRRVVIQSDGNVLGKIAASSCERISDSDSPTSHVEKNK